MNKLQKMEEKGVSKNTATEWNGLIKELEEIDLQLELQHRIQEQQKDEELQQEKVQKRQRRKLKKKKQGDLGAPGPKAYKTS